MHLRLDLLEFGEPSPREQRFGAFLTALSVAAIICLLLFFGLKFSNPYLRILRQLYLNYGYAPAMALSGDLLREIPEQHRCISVGKIDRSSEAK